MSLTSQRMAVGEWTSKMGDSYRSIGLLASLIMGGEFETCVVWLMRPVTVAHKSPGWTGVRARQIARCVCVCVCAPARTSLLLPAAAFIIFPPWWWFHRHLRIHAHFRYNRYGCSSFSLSLSISLSLSLPLFLSACVCVYARVVQLVYLRSMIVVWS